MYVLKNQVLSNFLLRITVTLPFITKQSLVLKWANSRLTIALKLFVSVAHELFQRLLALVFAKKKTRQVLNLSSVFCCCHGKKAGRHCFVALTYLLVTTCHDQFFSVKKKELHWKDQVVWNAEQKLATGSNDNTWRIFDFKREKASFYQHLEFLAIGPALYVYFLIQRLLDFWSSKTTSLLTQLVSEGGDVGVRSWSGASTKPRRWDSLSLGLDTNDWRVKPLSVYQFLRLTRKSE